MTGERSEVVAVDGCGAPLLPTSLTGLARGFSRLALGLDGSGESEPTLGRVADAIRPHPAYVSGSRRDERELLTAIPGAIGKAGAESCYAVALPDGRAFALKTDDGAPRVRPVLMAAALERSGVLDEPGVDADAVRRTGCVPLLGGGGRSGRSARSSETSVRFPRSTGETSTWQSLQPLPSRGLAGDSRLMGPM